MSLLLSEEGDSPVSCPKCNAQWSVLDGNTLVCKCGYRHIVPLKPSYDELVKENKLLKERLASKLSSKPLQ